MERYICIHGHFYQPPRENPWLEAVELQDSAYPYHDWNERIMAECYAPNSLSRILNGQNQIVKLVNNYSTISFDFGPTLLSWMQSGAPAVYRAILDADCESQKKFSGHGSALAQPYHHMILPLANRRDQYTQIVWGIRDFKRRFSRDPEGMWLPETAVSIDTLEIMAELGIRFTILAPHQAKRVRPIGKREWMDVSGAKIDPSRAYEQRLPSGRKISLFFYDGPICRGVAFEGLLSRGERFADRLIKSFSDERGWPQLVHIATDGESYGHHHRFGDMALAYALNFIELEKLARITNYGEYLEKYPPTHQVEIVERSSWSCAHGIDRWWRNCGCNGGGHSDWNQEWRMPLRNALDWLRDAIAEPFEDLGCQFLSNPWSARDDYIDVVGNRSPKNIAAWCRRHAVRELSDADRTTVLKLLELQRHAMVMYTSCGWFFDELSGIETVQVIQFAGRALQLAGELFGDSPEREFLERLAEAQSNLAEHGDGRQIYEKFVRPTMVDWERVGAHYAVSSLFEIYSEDVQVDGYRAHREDYHLAESGKARLALGRVRLTSDITQESCLLSFGVLHMGDHNVNCGVRKFLGDESYRELIRETTEPFGRADLAEVIRLMDHYFGQSNYSLRSLFRDEQRRILDIVMAGSLQETEALYQQIYENRAPMMRFITELNIPLPKAFHGAAEFVLNGYLREALTKEQIDIERVVMLIETTRVEGVAIDGSTTEFVFRRNLERMASRLAERPTDLALLRNLDNAASLLAKLPFVVDKWQVQNEYYNLLKNTFPTMLHRKGVRDELAQAWTESFLSLGRKIGVHVEEASPVKCQLGSLAEGHNADSDGDLSSAAS